MANLMKFGKMRPDINTVNMQYQMMKQGIQSNLPTIADPIKEEDLDCIQRFSDE